MGTLRWTLEASECLQEIHAYIAKDNPDAARRVIRDIYARAQDLKHFSKIGYEYTTRKGHAVRVLLFGHYRIVHQVLSDDAVEILGVFHGAMDLERILDAPP
ncbi:MAG TPA: type II toxin-antitoxin system RelE/ParE family toxin [Thermoanaerobaculia bacterium]|nr:type II toxin-antitoxin system RelE/ParE family toxin [Thermoanaerobaculia bacterium]